MPSENLAVLTESNSTYVKLRHMHIIFFLRFADESWINQKPILCRLMYQKQIYDLMSSSKVCWMCNWSQVYCIIYLRIFILFWLQKSLISPLPRTWFFFPSIQYHGRHQAKEVSNLHLRSPTKRGYQGSYPSAKPSMSTTMRIQFGTTPRWSVMSKPALTIAFPKGGNLWKAVGSMIFHFKQTR